MGNWIYLLNYSVYNLKTMLPNRTVLIVVLLVYHTRTTSPLWRPYYDRYPLTITDRVRYYCLAYVIQKYSLSVTLISFCVYHTSLPGYHNRLCNLVTNALKLIIPEWLEAEKSPNEVFHTMLETDEKGTIDRDEKQAWRLAAEDGIHCGLSMLPTLTENIGGKSSSTANLW